MVLGITGNIASGKSRIARLFGELGAAVVSADLLAREAVAPGSGALRQIVDRFGRGVLLADGELNRAALGQLVFADPVARRDLEAITHPAIADLAVRRLAALRAEGPPLIVYEAPLLYEAGAEDRVDRVLVVTVDPKVQLARLMARDQLDASAARQRIEAQLPQDLKAARADYVIDNSGRWQDCAAQVRALYERVRREGKGEG
ncbi:dephospho-CoA kinase [Geothermobacter hydrogeniphilus]|uniref:Dephospho-CoA kinase n=1 Tax=Geothermobacter hydrogeniphilus TaxID=1969733 RepID=A0A1X0XXW7_9BACT|nr:dephospho-CoA kinase [Geothermobacter hydrogeniphilus]ORJ57682.1 dephospho-CoA kinase [Geothermobacter hydrogeniphilus]